MSATINSVRQCVMGLGGTIVLAMPDSKKAPFIEVMSALYIHIERDTDGMNPDDLPGHTPLSPEASVLLGKAQTTKMRLLLEMRGEHLRPGMMPL